MTSINFNTAANSALRTLQSTNTQLDATQKRISTGLKIGEAKDNAAYWSISTTLKSDNKALSTVSEALGLGSATVDTAYQGLNSTLDVLNSIKSKLTAASQNGVDKKAVQSEIAELQNQLKSIASSSTFSGENWLSVSSATASFNPVKTVVSSFSRDAAGNAQLGTIAIDTSSFALLDTNTSGEGILDAGKSGNASNGGIVAAVAATTGTASSGTSTGAANYAYTVGTASTDRLQMTITVDSQTFSYDKTGSANFDTLDHLVASLNQTLGSAAVASNSGGKLLITSASTGTSSVVDITAVTPTGGTITAGLDPAADVLVTGNSTVAQVNAGATFGGSITLDDNDTISFKLALNGADPKTITIDQATVNSALNRTDGKITAVTDYATVITKALANANIGGVTVDTTGGTTIRFTSTIKGTQSSIQVLSSNASKGDSILTMDVSNADADTLTKYLNAVSGAISKVTSAAATLGAVSSRIDLQKTFVSKMMDTIDKGVSGLVDADMNEESTKLQALQVKQQLGVQALSIANQSAQNVLSLFRS
ncbi:flagellin [Aureimonas sp. AU4]|uniref:flagellin N-terminal helical domain-containing protein n=1 Tax=Aureimonas sp. AU4 TaxID=1638163 RepID=UPI000781C0C3|nr:flagellin [Aureimonas sp. AU4]